MLRHHHPGGPAMRRPFSSVAMLPFRLALFPALLLTAAVVAQQQVTPGLPLPRIDQVTPPGAKAGSTVEVVITGTELEEAEGLRFSHPGIRAEMLPDPPPDPKKPPQPPPKRGQGQLMAHKFKVTVPPDVPLGMHDVRVLTKIGLSNPRVFMVGDLNEVVEKEPNNDVEQAQPVELNTTINGVLTPATDVDYFAFKGQKGQKVVVSCLTSSIESRAHPVIEVYESSTKRLLAANRDYSHHDALLDVVLPDNGDYYVRLFQFTHLTGGPDHYYRLSITTAPWIDAVFPPIVEPGKPAQLTVYGRNLPGGQPDPSAVVNGSVLEKATVTVNVPNDPAALTRLAHAGHIPPASALLDGFDYTVKNAAGTSNPYLLMYSRNPVVLDHNANLTRETAQVVPPSCEVAGRLDKVHPHAWYAFEGKKDAVYSIELLGDRINSPLDLAFTLYAADGKSVVTEQDDDPEILSNNQFFTRTSDPARFPFRVPADGKFLLLVKSQETPNRAGPRQLYRLRIAPEQPDFRLVVMASSPIYPEVPTVRQGCHQDVHVYVWRRDGFNGEVALTMEGLPPGVTCVPQVLGPGIKQGSLILSADAGAAPWTGEVKVKGTATINGQPVVREARAATITWAGNPQQANVPTFTRLDHNLMLAVREKGPYTLTAGPPDKAAVQGDKITIPLKVERFFPDFKAPVSVTALNLPAGVQFNNNNQPQAVANDNAPLVLTVQANAPPGTYTIAFRGSAQFPYSRDPMAKQKPNITANFTTAPITITVIPKQLAQLTLAPPNAQAKLGANVEVVVKVVRQFDYAGEFKVSLVQPPNAKGITAPEVTIPAGQNEAKLVLTVAADAPPGNRNDLVVRAVAMFGNTPVTHEQKLAVNIIK